MLDVIIGFDSLMAVQLKNQIKADLEIDVSVIKFMDGLSVTDLAALLNRSLPEEDRDWVTGEI